jgi:hypothetical protein
MGAGQADDTHRTRARTGKDEIMERVNAKNSSHARADR